MRREMTRARLMFCLLALCAVLTLAGCDSPLTSTSATTPTINATPSGPLLTDPQQILKKAQSVKLDDATLTQHIETTRNGQSVALDGTMKFTTNPSRIALTENAGLLSYQGVIDGGTLYLKLGSKWSKTTLASNNLIAYNYDAIIGQLRNPTLVGMDTINGALAYHLRGTVQPPVTPTSGQSISTPSADLWVRQDTYLPAKATINVSGTLSGQPTTIALTGTFTAWNTGLTIDVPTVG